MKPRMPYMKALYVSFCVVFMAIAAPAAYEPNLLSSFGWAAFFRMVLTIMSISFTVENLQDLRDIKEDRKSGVVTLPSGFGVAWTTKLLIATQITCCLMHFGLSAASILPLRPDMLVVHFLSMLCVWGFGEKTPRYLFQIVLEPLYISPLLMLFLRQ